MSSAEFILETHELTKEFKGFVAVNKVNLKVRRGQIHALIGPNGAGKTTCFNLLTKFLTPTSGRIVFDGTDITAEAPAHIARRGVIRSFQISAVFPHLSVLENVRVALQRKLGTSFSFWRTERTLDALNGRAIELLDAVDLGKYAAIPAVELSYGRKRALEIATTLAMDPKLMLLDEPTQGMGLEDVDRIRALIKKVSADRTILMVEHNMSVVASHRRHDHRAATRRDAGRRAVRAGVEEPGGDRGLHGQRADRVAGGALTMAQRFLEIRDLHAWYGESHVLHGVNFHVDEGEVVTLLGRNGAGRTSTMRAILGLTGSRKGSVKVKGNETIGMATHRIARLGLGYCPEERAIFSSLSAEENLMLPPTLGAGGMSVEQIYTMFPNLKERAASQGTRLSGGEQQMLAVARILRTGAKLLLLDEISEGLAPVIVQKLAEMVLSLRKQGYTIVMVEQNFRFAAPLADRFMVMEHGQVIQEFTQAELPQRMDRLHEYLGV